MKTVEFEGQTHQFPDDFSNDDIAAALQSHNADTKAPQNLAEKHPWSVDWKTGAVHGPLDALADPEDRKKLLNALPGYLTQRFLPGLIEGPKAAMSAPGQAYAAGASGNVPSVGEMIEPAANLGMLLAGPGASRGDVLVGRTRGEGFLSGASPKPPVGPTEAELNAATNSGYEGVRNSGVELKQAAVAKRAAAALQEMDKTGTIAESPTSVGILQRLSQTTKPELQNMGSVMAGAEPRFSEPPTVGIQDILDAQQALSPRNAIKDHPVGRAIALRHLHSILEDVNPAEVAAGDPGAAAAALKEAAANSRALANSRKLSGAEIRAQNNADTANSGHNIGNNLRQQVKALVQPRVGGEINPNARTFSPELMASAQSAIKGSPGGNIARSVGNFFGGGGGLGSFGVGTVGGSVAGELTHTPLAGLIGGLTAMAAGRAGRAIDNAMVGNMLEKLQQQARNESPFAKQMGVKPYVAPARVRKLLAREATKEATKRGFSSSSQQTP